MKCLYAIGALWLLCFSTSICHADVVLKQTDSMRGYFPKEGFVPNSRTAIAIAIAVLVPIYGEEEIREKFPFVATLNSEKWIVKGSLPKNAVGGVPEVHISKLTGEIIKVSSGK